MQNDKKIIYCALIKNKRKIIAEYTIYSGNFGQIVKRVLNKCIYTIYNKNMECFKAYFSYGRYNFFSLGKGDLCYLLMTCNIGNDIDIYFDFLFSLAKFVGNRTEFEDIKVVKSINNYLSGLYNDFNLHNFSKISKSISDFPTSQFKNNIYLTKKQFAKTSQLPVLSNEAVHNLKGDTYENENIEAERAESFNDDLINPLYTVSQNQRPSVAPTDFLNSITNSREVAHSFSKDNKESSAGKNVLNFNLEDTDTNINPRKAQTVYLLDTIVNDEGRDSERSGEMGTLYTNQGGCPLCIRRTAKIILIIIIVAVIAMGIYILLGYFGYIN